MPTGLTITLTFNFFALALLASVLFGFDAGERGKPIKPATPATPAMMVLPAPSLARSPATPLIHGEQAAQALQAAPDVIQMVRQIADRDKMAEPWLTLGDGSLRARQ